VNSPKRLTKFGVNIFSLFMWFKVHY